MEEEMISERVTKVRLLIEKATNSTESEVDPRLLKAIKITVRYSESELRVASQTLIARMKRRHSQVRYLSLLIIDVLFMRSKLFRTLIVENLDQLLSLSVGFRKTHPLPPPSSVATILRAKAIKFLENWNESYGIYYRQLRLGVDYLKNTLRYQFPNLQANAARAQQERREREIRSKEILKKKFEVLEECFSSVKEEIQSTTDEIGECVEILRAEDDNMSFECPLDDEDVVEFRSNELRQLRLASLSEVEKVQENNDNSVVFDVLRELYKLLVTKHLVTVQEWISVLIRVELDDNRLRDSFLKEFIDIKNHILGAKKKCEETGCALPDPRGDDEELLWEEGVIGSADARNSIQINKSVNGCEVASTSAPVSSKDVKESSSKGSRSKIKESLNDGASKGSDPVRDQLLAEAPVLKWNSFLDQWGAKRDVLANQRGLELDSHWGRVDYDAVIPAERIAELSYHASVYEEKDVEIRPCQAPLKKGGLCQRRDLRVCPFHGPMVPRDDEGKPIYHDDTTLGQEHYNRHQTDKHPSIDQYPDMKSGIMEGLARQAVKNVRQKDKDDVRKKEDDRKLKRAKLAKVREHNEAVLREASLASTSRSSAIGEYIDTIDNGGRRPTTKQKKATLASMLRRKVTAKDRLAGRLQSSKASDATIRQLTQGEDRNYREAFPNQW
ncbi:hypothetical protein V2J09_004415 [Rumex salicifolius]